MANLCEVHSMTFKWHPLVHLGNLMDSKLQDYSVATWCNFFKMLYNIPWLTLLPAGLSFLSLSVFPISSSKSNSTHFHQHHWSIHSKRICYLWGKTEYNEIGSSSSNSGWITIVFQQFTSDYRSTALKYKATSDAYSTLLPRRKCF